MTDDIAEIKNLRDDLHARAQVAPTALSERELRLVHHYGEIKDDTIRDGVYSLIRALNLKDGEMDDEAAAWPASGPRAGPQPSAFPRYLLSPAGGPLPR